MSDANTTHPRKRGPGRPPLSPEQKRARRNARERARREARREELGSRDIPVTPFARGFDILETGVGKPASAISSPADLDAALTVPTGLPLRHELSAKQLEHAEGILSVLRGRQVSGLAENSRRAMAADWRHWTAFCLEYDRPVLPVLPDSLMDFLDALQRAGYRRATLAHMIYTIRYTTKIYDCPDPTDNFGYISFWKDMCREKLSSRQDQATGLTWDVLQVLLRTLDPTDPLSCRDSAMVSVMYDAMLRPSELVALSWRDLDMEADRSDGRGGTLLITRSKTDQDSAGHEVYVRPETIEALKRWKAFSDPQSESIFHAVRRVGDAVTVPAAPLSVRTIKHCLTRLAATAGVDAIDLSGHSGRVGGAQDMTEWGVALPEIMQIGRWKSPAMPARYAERRNAVNAGKTRFARAPVTREDPPQERSSARSIID